jgi:hypothetical protein
MCLFLFVGFFNKNSVFFQTVIIYNNILVRQEKAFTFLSARRAPHRHILYVGVQRGGETRDA